MSRWRSSGMDLCEKKYPYPVLLPYGDDYVGCQFEVKIESIKTSTEISFRLETTLDCPDLEEAVAKGEAAIILHIECPQSAYRKSFIIPRGSYTLPAISTNDLSGKISLCPFIIAQKNIDKYQSDKFNPVYSGLNFNIRCGAVLAEGEQMIDYANTTTRDIDFKPDIFSIVPYDAKPDDHERVRFDPFNTKIKIKLPRKIFVQYNSMLKSGDYKELLWSTIILPAVMEALHQIQLVLKQNEELGDFEDFIWYQKIIERIEYLHPEAKLDRIHYLTEKMSVPDVAQELIKYPISKAISKVASMGETMEGDDEH